MLIPSTSTDGFVEINFISANLKMAVKAEAEGDKPKAEFHFNRALAREIIDAE